MNWHSGPSHQTFGFGWFICSNPSPNSGWYCVRRVSDISTWRSHAFQSSLSQAVVQHFSAFKFQHLTILVLRMSREREPHTCPLWSEIGLWSSLDLWYFDTSSFMSQEDTRWKYANDQQLHLGRHCHWARGRNIYLAVVLHVPNLAATPVGGLGTLSQVPQKGGCMYPRVWRGQLASCIFVFLLIESERLLLSAQLGCLGKHLALTGKCLLFLASDRLK